MYYSLAGSGYPQSCIPRDRIDYLDIRQVSRIRIQIEVYHWYDFLDIRQFSRIWIQIEVYHWYDYLDIRQFSGIWIQIKMYPLICSRQCYSSPEKDEKYNVRKCSSYVHNLATRFYPLKLLKWISSITKSPLNSEKSMRKVNMEMEIHQTPGYKIKWRQFKPTKIQDG